MQVAEAWPEAPDMYYGVVSPLRHLTDYSRITDRLLMGLVRALKMRVCDR